MSSTWKELRVLHDHFAKIPDTPVANLFRCITVVIEEVKRDLIEIDENENIELSKVMDDSAYEIFRSRLIEIILNDRQLMELIDLSNVKSFVHDCVTIYWEEKTKSFHACTYSTEKAIEFFVQWLYLINPNEEKSLKKAVNQDVWYFANLCTLLEYEQNEILSFYAACRVTENLSATSSNSFYTTLLVEKPSFRTKVREKLFVCMFQRLWRRFCRMVGQSEENPKFWISQYALISNYYPVEHAPQLDELKYMKDRLDLMYLTYLIFVNGQMFRPVILIRQLLNLTEIYKDTLYGQTNICLRKLPNIIDEILKHCQTQSINQSKMMIDIQRWIIRLLKTSQEQSLQPEILSLFKFLNKSKYSLSLDMKQFLFDELCNIQIDILSNNRNNANQSMTSFWDHICLLPTIISCVDCTKIKEYQLPYHPSVVSKPNENHTLLDLYFFHLRRLSSEDFRGIDLIYRIMESKLPAGIDPQYMTLSEQVFNQLKAYFSLQMVATLVCSMDANVSNQEQIDAIVKEIINRYLNIDVKSVQSNKHLEFFLSIIISKKSWTFLTDLLKSQRFQRLNSVWANTLHSLLPTDLRNQTKKLLRFCHKVQFAMHPNEASSIFPTLHKPYHDLQQLIHQCVQISDLNHRWTALIKWIKSKSTTRILLIDRRPEEIKVMLLLNIYYNYYCTNQLHLLAGFSKVLDSVLHLSPEERLVFNAFLQPKEFMAGYTDREDDPDKNFLNDLFHLNFADEDELPIRHTLVNLLAMILLGGKQSFLWPFAFDPSQLSETYGFGSLRSEPISVIVHYDCGCFLTETGALVFPPLGRGLGSLLNVPAVYVAYFATFGAMAWHLLLYKNSPETVYGPILAKHAVDSKNPAEGMNGDSLRARVCHFVRARIVSTNFFLVQKSNQDETCILLTRCFEQLASLSRESIRNTWIKPVFKTHQERYEAEKGFQDQVFYPMYRKVPEDAKFIVSLDLRSVIQKNLQEYMFQLPVMIEFEHFKTELCNPKYSSSPLTILKYVLDSLDYLQIIKYIYDLSRFHLLLHRTFSHLIEKDELLIISLRELYERSRKYFARLQQADQSTKHLSIILNGIEAVNGYHQFSGGQIRPGACEVTQGFQMISIETPVNYLIETDDFDAGNIIMRIITVLVSFHNHSVDLLEKEIVENDRFGSHDRELKRLIQYFVKREISILQIAQEFTGINTIDGNERRIIERLAQASLQNQRSYYLRSDTPPSFDYVPIQSYIIRTYLLHFRIKYDQLQGKYQYYIKKKVPAKMNNGLSLPLTSIDQSLRAQWSHLEQMSVQRLQKELELLRLIDQAIKTSNDKNVQQMSFSGFIHSKEYAQRCTKEFEEHEIQDFPLHSLGDICRLYEEMIDYYRSCFINIPPGLRVPLEQTSNAQLDHNLRNAFLPSSEQMDTNLIEKRLQTLSEFINDLLQAESMFDKQWAKSFRETCEILCFHSECYESIPPDITGASFVPVCQTFIDLRSELYEKKLNTRKPKVILQKLATALQNTYADNHGIQSVPKTVPVPPQKSEQSMTTLKPMEPTVTNSSDLNNESTATTILSIVSTKSPFSHLLKAVRDKVKEMKSRKALPRFILSKNGSPIAKIMVQPDQLHRRFREILQKPPFNPAHLSIIDMDNLAIDFSTDEHIRPTVDQYHVINRSILIPIKVNLEDTMSEYHCTSEANLSSVCSLFFLDHPSFYQQATSGYQFVDSYGQVLLDDYPIKSLDRINSQEPIYIRIIPCESEEGTVSEVTVKRNDKLITTVTLSPSAKWTQLLDGLLRKKTLPKPQNLFYQFWYRNNKSLIDKNEPLVNTASTGVPLIEVEIIDGLVNTDDLRQKNSQNSFIMLTNSVANGSFNEKVDESLPHLASIQQASRRIEIIWYDEKTKTKFIELPHPHGAFTIKQMLALITDSHDRHFLASTVTKKVFSDKTPLDAIKDDKFYLVRNYRTCSIGIQQADTSRDTTPSQSNKTQRYIIDATLHNVCKQNLQITAGRHIQYNNDFILAGETPLSMLISDEKIPIQLCVVQKLLVTIVTITCDEQDRPIKFACQPTIIVRRIREMVENFWTLPKGYYCLATNSGGEIDDDTSILEEFGNCVNVQLRVALLFEEKCSITFYDRKMISPVQDTLASTIFDEAIQRFHIPQDDRSLWTLFVMDDPEFPTEMDLHQPIDKVYEFLPRDKNPIPLQLRRCDEEMLH